MRGSGCAWRAAAGGVVVWLAAASSSCAPAPPREADLLLRGGVVWTGVGDAPAAERDVLIDDGRIVAVGAAGELEAEGAKTLDLAGAFVLPGLIDNHVHVLDRLVDDPTATREGLRRWLCAGVTTLVDNGSTLAALRRFVASAPDPEAPRILPAGPVFTAPGGYPFGQSLEVSGPEEARAGARRVFASGARLLKAAVESGFLTGYPDAAPAPGPAPGASGDLWPVPSPGTVEALADAARREGIPARAHVTQSSELRVVLDAGFGSVAHTPVDRIPDELLRRAVAADLAMVSTLSLWEDAPDLAAAARDNLLRFRRLGGRVAFGTDAPGFTPGYALATGELRALSAAGLSNLEVLRSATVDGARAAGVAEDLGTLEVGRRAHLLVVRGDPTTRLSDLGRVEWVISGGRVVRSPGPGCGGALQAGSFIDHGRRGRARRPAPSISPDVSRIFVAKRPG